MQLTEKNLNKISTLQRNEITEHHIYLRIAQVTPDPHNRDVLSRIAAEELTHYAIWKQYTAKEIAPSMLRVWFYYLIARLLGMTFAIKLMEGVEQGRRPATRPSSRLSLKCRPCLQTKRITSGNLSP